ncbi:MAG: hypothetical protein WD509_01285 [Candidatus Paceibacterota bacterium]
MKRIIFISLILTLLYVPVSFNLDTTNNFEPLIANANHSDEQHPGIVGEDTSPQSGSLTTDSSGVTREAFSPISNAFNEFMENVALLPIFISGFFVYVAGALFDVSILETVSRLGVHFSAVDGINIAWGTLRDLANILFIFGLLTIAISTILGLSGFGYKKLLARLIIVALLINFSLFFTKFVIDASNIFALQFYQQLSVPDADGTRSISNIFRHALGLDTLWSTETVLNRLNQLNYNSSGGFGLMFLYSIFTSIFLFITAFVFMFGAILLIVRAVGFILLAILSPVAFAAYVLPTTQKWTDMWWKKLWEYAIFAPAFLLMLWITASIIPSITATFAPNGGGLLEAISSNPEERIGSVSMILNFIILISLLIASIVISNKLSIAGSEKLTKMGKSLGKFGAGKALALPFGLTAALGRNLPGRGLRALSNSQGLKDVASGKRNFKPLAGDGVFARGANIAANKIAQKSAEYGLKGARVGADANFDARAFPGAGAVIKSTGLNLGKPRKGGYETTIKKQVEDRKKFGESLGNDSVTQDALIKPLEKEQGEIKGRKKEQEGEKTEDQNRIKNLSRQKQALVRDGKEYSNEMNALDVELNKAESKLADTENTLKRIGDEEKKIKEQLDAVNNIGKERAKSFAQMLASEKTVDTLWFKVPRKNKEAGIAMMKGKSDEDKLIEGLTKKMKKEKKESDTDDDGESSEKKES